MTDALDGVFALFCTAFFALGVFVGWAMFG